MKRAWVLAGALALLAGSARAEGTGVVVVRSSELAPYKALEESFTSTVGVPVKSVSLADPAAARTAATGGAVVLAIGQDAAKLVLDARPPGLVIFGLVPAPEKLGTGEASKAVPMFASAARQLQALKDVLPNAKKVGIIYGPTSEGLLADYERAAKAAGLTVVGQSAKDRTVVAAALRAVIDKIDALVLLPDPVTLGVDTFKFLLTTSLESKVPMVGFSQGQARAGALLAVEADYAEMGREAAAAAKRALAGGTPNPQAPNGSLFINGKTAQVLGVSLSPQVKSQTKEVF